MIAGFTEFCDACALLTHIIYCILQIVAACPVMTSALTHRVCFAFIAILRCIKMITGITKQITFASGADRRAIFDPWALFAMLATILGIIEFASVSVDMIGWIANESAFFYTFFIIQFIAVIAVIDDAFFVYTSRCTVFHSAFFAMCSTIVDGICFADIVVNMIPIS